MNDASRRDKAKQLSDDDTGKIHDRVSTPAIFISPERLSLVGESQQSFRTEPGVDVLEE
jgi:hypothetical protein